MVKFKSIKIFIVIAVAVLLSSICAVSVAAWQGGIASLSVTGTTGYWSGHVETVGDIVVTPADGTYVRDENGGLHMEKLYPVDHLGDGLKFWTFDLAATNTTGTKFKFTIEGSVKIDGVVTDAAALYWTTEPITNVLDPGGKALGKGVSDIFVADGVTKTTVYVYMTANSVQAMNATVSLKFGITARIFEGKYDLNEWDMSKITADEPRIVPLGGEPDIVVYTVKSYDVITASILLKMSTSAQEDGRTQGIMFKFENDEVIFVRAHYDGNHVYLQRMPWDEFDKYVFAKFDENGWSGNFYTFTDEETEAYLNGGIRFTALRSGNAIYYYIGNNLACVRDGESTPALDSDYADLKVHVGFFGVRIQAPLSFRIYDGAMEIDYVDETAADAHGVVTADKPSYRLNDTINLTVKPDDGYVLDALVVNGVDVSVKGQNNTYSFTATPQVSIKATFKPIEYIKGVDLPVKGKKKNVTSALSGSVTLTNMNGKFVIPLNDGKLAISEGDRIPSGRYSLSADGYISKTVDMVSGMTDGITLDYKLFASGGRDDMSVYNEDNWDISEINGADPTLTPKHKSDLVAYSADYYDDVTASLLLKHDNTEEKENAHGILFKFAVSDDETKDEVIFVRVHEKDGQIYLQRTPWKDFSNYVFGEYDQGGWSDDFCTFTEEERDAYYSAGGIKFTAVRKGNSLYYYIGNRLAYTRDGKSDPPLDEKYASMKMQVGIFGSDIVQPLYFDISEGAPLIEYIDETEEGAGGSLAVETKRTSDIALGDKITITALPNEGYVLDVLIVNGNDVTKEIENGSYTFAATPTVTVKATFKPIE